MSEEHNAEQMAPSPSPSEDTRGNMETSNLLEQTAQNLILFDIGRSAEIEELTKVVEEQHRLMEKLQKNRNEILLETNLLEKKIEEVRVHGDVATIMRSRVVSAAERIRKQMKAGEMSFDAFEDYRQCQVGLREGMDVEKAAYLMQAVHAERMCQALNGAKEKARDMIIKESGRLRRDRANCCLELTKNWAEIERILAELVQTKCLAVGNKAWLARLGHSGSVFESLTQLRKVVTIFREKFKSLKKIKRERDERCRIKKEEIEKISKDTKELSLYAEKLEVEHKTELKIETQKNELIAEMEVAVNELSKASEAVQTDMKEKIATLESKELERNQLLEKDSRLKEQVAEAETAYLQTNVALNGKLQEAANHLAKAEQKRLLLEGRVLEVTQQAAHISDELKSNQDIMKDLDSQLKIKKAEVSHLQNEYNNLVAENETQMEHLEAFRVKAAEVTSQEAEKIKMLEEKALLIQKIQKNTEEILKKKADEEKACKELEGEQNRLLCENDEMRMTNDELREWFLHIERHIEMFQKHKDYQESSTKNFEQIREQGKQKEAEFLKNIEEKQSLLKSLERIASENEDEMKELAETMTAKRTLVEQNNEETLKLKQLLRECDASLAKETKEGENLAEQLAKKRLEREEESRVMERKRREEQEKELQKKQRQLEAKKLETEKEIKKMEERRKEEAKLAEIAVKKRQKEAKSRKINTGKNAADKDNAAWMALINNAGNSQTRVKIEKPDDYPTPPPMTPQGIIQKKFFKSRFSEPARKPIYAAGGKMLKKPPGNTANVFDYETDDEIQYLGSVNPKTKDRKNHGGFE